MSDKPFDTWRTRAGKMIKISSMSTPHIQACMELVRNVKESSAIMAKNDTFVNLIYGNSEHDVNVKNELHQKYEPEDIENWANKFLKAFTGELSLRKIT